jgi:hypothetical protein
MDGFLYDLDIPEGHIMIVPKQLVVISRDVDDIGAVFGLSQNRPQYVVVRLRPEDPPLHFPDIDDVSNEVQILAVERMEEVEEVIGAAATKTQMNVRDPNSAERELVKADRLSHPLSLQ